MLLMPTEFCSSVQTLQVYEPVSITTFLHTILDLIKYLKVQYKEKNLIEICIWEILKPSIVKK